MRHRLRPCGVAATSVATLAALAAALVTSAVAPGIFDRSGPPSPQMIKPSAPLSLTSLKCAFRSSDSIKIDLFWLQL